MAVISIVESTASVSSVLDLGLPIFDFDVEDRTPFGGIFVWPASMECSILMCFATHLAIRPGNPFKYPNLIENYSVGLVWLPKLT